MSSTVRKIERQARRYAARKTGGKVANVVFMLPGDTQVRLSDGRVIDRTQYAEVNWMNPNAPIIIINR